MHKCKCSDIIFKQGLRQCKTSCWFDALITGIHLNNRLRHLFKPILKKTFDICSNSSCDARRQYLKELASVLGYHNFDEGNQSYLLWHKLLKGNIFPCTYIMNFGGFEHLKLNHRDKLVAVVNPHGVDIAHLMLDTLNIKCDFKSSSLIVSTTYPFSMKKYKLQMVTVSTGTHVVSLIRCDNGKKWIKYDNESSIQGFFVKDQKFLSLNNKLFSKLGYTICIYTKLR
jgi:hypothetical protein